MTSGYGIVHMEVFLREAGMRATTVLLPPELKSRALERAQKLGISLGEMVRRALRAELGRSRNPREDDPFLADDALFSGETPPDLARDHDRHLYGEDA